MFQNLAEMNRRRVEIAVVVVVFAAIIGYAGVGFVVSATRVANAERTLNAAVSHQTTLNSIFAGINTQLSQLSSGSAFNPQQAIVLVDKSISNSELATKTINGDDASLDAAGSQLQATPWLTVVGKSSLDRQFARIRHARNALAAARTIADGEVQDGHFWHSLYTALADLTTVNTQSGGGDLTGAKTTLDTMKADIDEATKLSTSPGLPSDLHSLTTDLQAFAADYGKKLDAQLAGDDVGVAAYQASVAADLQKIGAYDFDKIGADINAFYKPLIDRFNAEISAATG